MSNTPPSVQLTYKGQVIAEMRTLGNINISTAGKYCEDDIKLNYINYCPRIEDYSDYNIGDFYSKYSLDTAVTVFDLSAQLTALSSDYSYGYINGNSWVYSGTETTYRSDVYQVNENRDYIIGLGSTVGNRFYVLFTTEDVTQATADISGILIKSVNSPSANVSITYRPTSNGYITIMKSTNSVDNITTVVKEGEFI